MNPIAAGLSMFVSLVSALTVIGLPVEVYQFGDGMLWRLAGGYDLNNTIRKLQSYFDFNRYRRGLETCPQAKTSKSGHAIFFFFSGASERRV